MTHTPGPWELLDGRNIKTVNGIFFLSYGCDEHSKKPFFFSKENGWSELDANAKLTAAAPELLYMVQEFIFTLQDEHGSYYVDGNIIKGKALWEKASGETWKDEELEEDDEDNEVEVEVKVEGEQL